MTTCTLSQSDSYIQTVTVTPIAAHPGSFELLFQSQLLSAKNPAALQVQHRTIVTAQGLGSLRDLINQCLAA